MIVFGRARWEGTDANDPGKLLAQEVFTTAKARLARIVPSRNGASPGTVDREASPGTGETASHN